VELRDECMTTLNSGELITTELAIVMLLRLTQIGAGFITPVAGAEPVRWGNHNPRAELLREWVRDVGSQVIVWHQFQHDAGEIASALGKRSHQVYTSAREEEVMRRFHKDGSDLVANLNSLAREGYTLTEAKVAVYYSRSAKYIHRRQSED